MLDNDPDVPMKSEGESESETIKVEEGVNLTDLSVHSENTGSNSAAVQEPAQFPRPPGSTFEELLKRKYELDYQKSENLLAVENDYYENDIQRGLEPPVISLEEDRNMIRWNILGLQESKKRIEQELKEMEERLQIAEEKQQLAANQLATSLEAAGISQELYDAYEAFCQSLDPGKSASRRILRVSQE